MVMVNEDLAWTTFGRCSRKMNSCVLRDEVTVGEERRNFVRHPTVRLVLIPFSWMCGCL